MKNIHSILAWKAMLLAAKTGSISQTAMLMDISLTKASLLISGLEKEVGFPLLDRNTRPFRPTKQAEFLIPLALPIVKSFEEMLQLSKGAGEKIVIRIASPIEIAQEFYSSKLIAYSKTHTNVVFEMVRECSPDALFSGEADVTVVNQKPLDESNLVVRPFMRTSTPVLCSPEYLRRYGVPKTPEDLSEHTGLLQKTHIHLTTQFLYSRDKESSLLKWRTQFFTHDQLTIKRHLLNHQGISPDLYFGHVLPELQNGSLIPILPGWERTPWDMAIVTRQDKEFECATLRSFAMWWAQSENASALERVIQGRKVIAAAQERADALIAEIEKQ